MNTKFFSILFLVTIIVGCGSSGSSITGSSFSTQPGVNDPLAPAKASATGQWVTIANDTITPPSGTVAQTDTSVKFFSYNQPSVNNNSQIVFRARARGPMGSGGGVLSGVWTTNFAFDGGVLTTVADRNTLVPDPNSEGATFNEFPSIPRIDAENFLMGTRGNHEPVETFVLPDMSETKAGSNGLYSYDGQLKTVMSILGNFSGFHYFAVPGAPFFTKFDVFPGSPSFTDGKYVCFKGNYVVPINSQTVEPQTESQTGVFFRDITIPMISSVLVANSKTTIPGQSVNFGSTAPPSAAKGTMVFAGYDIEEAPTLGGIYRAALTSSPTLVPLIEVGSVVPGPDGQPLGDGSTFTAFGEALSYDGRFLSFWGAWGTDTREVILECPEDGNQDLIDYCLANSPLPGGRTPVDVPVNQGIFVQDTSTGLTRLVARAGTGQEFFDFLFWNYSGRPPGTGGGDEEDGEPPRWRSSAFTAIDGARGVVFKGVKTPGPGVAEAGIYAVATADGLSSVLSVLEIGQSAGGIDPDAPADSFVVEVGIEREAFRDGWFVLTASFLNAAEEGWAGIYATYVPDVNQISDLLTGQQ